MASSVTFTVPRPPVPKDRPRKGKYDNFYTPRETKAYEKVVAQWYATVRKGRPPHAGDVRMELDVAPDGVRVTLHFLDSKTPKVRGDLSNIAKAVEDALNTLAYRDDRQIVSLVVNACQTVKEATDG